MQSSQQYIKYLQQLLEQNKIEYQSQANFKENKSKTEGADRPHIQENTKEFISGPLQTNLRPELFGDQLNRYSRQMLLKQIKYEGQLKIVHYKIAVIGAGGIGCPLALYLAGAGVGTIGLFDSDVVDMTNLHRQIGHNSKTIGMKKTQSLKKTLLKLNPHIVVKQHTNIEVKSLSQLDYYDLVIDGSDNPQCRYLVNDYLMSKNRLLLSGACVGWEGQVTCYGGQSACYRCIWGNDQTSMGGCSTIGVVGMLPGLVAMILGVQALKIILNKTSSLQGQLLTYDGRSCNFRKMKLRNKKKQCLACGQQKMDVKSYDYNRYSGCSTGSAPPPQVPSIDWAETVTKLKDDSDNLLLDVRSKGQYDILNIKNSLNIPYEQLKKMDQQKLLQVLGNKQKQIFVSCRIGFMSKKATDFLLKHGYSQALNVQGGINKYGNLFDPNIVNI